MKEDNGEDIAKDPDEQPPDPALKNVRDGYGQ
jgi:hypothetical protein